jgi:4-hydroxy-tetrahydrodipicolinate reductase
MGTAVCAAVQGDPELELVAAVDPGCAGTPLADVAGIDSPLVVGDRVDSLADAGAEVAVDFTVAGAAVAHMAWCAEHGVHAVVGTTGVGDEELLRAGEDFSAGRANCVVAANFAVTAVLMMRFAELAAPFVDGLEIVELHHDAKRDAPSGTALRTAARAVAARSAAGAEPWRPDATTELLLPGARGAAVPGGVRIHSVRLQGLVAHQEVLMGARGQSLVIRHDAFDRSSFMPGVLLAAKSVAGRPGLTIGLDALLGI